MYLFNALHVHFSVIYPCQPWHTSAQGRFQRFGQMLHVSRSRCMCVFLGLPHSQDTRALIPNSQSRSNPPPPPQKKKKKKMPFCSDDGRLFIWDKETGELVQILQGDGEVVNQMVVCRSVQARRGHLAGERGRGCGGGGGGGLAIDIFSHVEELGRMAWLCDAPAPFS